MCSTCLILVKVSVISWRKPSDSSQKSLSCKTDVFIGKDCEKSLKYLHEAYFCNKIQLWNQNCGTEWSWAEMTSDHINLSTLKAISAFITKNIFNVLLFFSNGGRT